jgi:glyoxylase-like metal-dependent hydrolase (beta-lactamase superfamily II)
MIANSVKTIWKDMAQNNSRNARKILTAAMVVAMAAVSAILPATASAAPPVKQTTQVPGYYRLNVGDIEVTALYDGYVALDNKLLKGASANDIQQLLGRMFIASSKGVQTAVNAFLINTGKNLILVDTGAAKCFGPTLGVIGDNLRAAGYEPAQIDSVLLTHLHGDHVCGLVAADGKPAFPNATVYVSRDEAGFWLNKDIAAKAPKEAQGFFKMAEDSVAPYARDGKVKQFAAGDKLMEDVVSVPTPGHTPGHAGYMFSSGDQQLLVWGDIVHSHAVQFARPEVSIEFDVDNKKAIATRKKVFADAVKNKLWIAGAHLPFPGIGHVRAEKKGYAWVPLEYSPVIPK